MSGAAKAKAGMGAGQKSIAAFFKPRPVTDAPPVSNVPLESAKPAQPSTQKKANGAAPLATAVMASMGEANAAKQRSGGPPGAEVVGQRVSVFWPEEKAWFEGVIKQASAEKGKHFVEYDDGDTEWIRLDKEEYRLLGREVGNKKGRQPVLQSDSEGEEVAEEGDSGSEYAGEEESEESEGDESEMDEEDEDEELGKTKKRKPAAASASAPKQPPARKRQAVEVSVKRSPPVAATKSFQLTATPPQSRPQPGAKASLQRALGSQPEATAAAAASASVKIANRELTGEAVRFAARDADRFKHLMPEHIRDANKRRPGEPGYNPETLYIPPNWFTTWKISEGQRQWWAFKAAHYGSVLLFKMGKFYEMFEMDAHVGAEVLGLAYMKGDQPHAGFPEKNYHQNAELLARAGHRVVVIEQTETPEMLARRNAERQAAGQRKAMVVAREQVAVLTRATLMEPEMLASNPEASYLLAIAEAPNADPQLPVRIGFVVVDCPTGEVVVGQWADDALRSRLRAHLTAFKPVEVVLPGEEEATAPSQPSLQCLRACLRNPRLSRLSPEEGRWDGKAAVASLQEGGYFKQWPSALQALDAAGAAGDVGLGAMGGLLAYLRSVGLDRAVLAQGKLALLPESDCAAGVDSMDGDLDGEESEFMTLDGAALENLEVLENSTGGAAGTLIASLDNCATACGRRLLRQWLLRPLGRIVDIEARQDAVEDLISVASQAVGDARRLMAGMADLERGLARLQACGIGAGSGRDADNVVLYEDQGKRRVGALLSAINGLKALQQAAECFEGVRGELRSTLLLRLVTPGQLFPDMTATLQAQEGIDWAAAAETGQVVPLTSGVDAAYDEARAAVSEAEAELKEYLREVQSEVARSVRYTSANKDAYLLEVPDEAVRKVPGDWELRGTKKGYRRYMSAQLTDLVAVLDDAQLGLDKAMGGILSGLISKFNENAVLWRAAVSAASQLDALASLAAAASSSHIPVCRPKFIRSDRPVFDAKALCHPAGITGRDGVFVPNGISLGGSSSAPPFMLLTGPNMGGKSTLLRQVSLAVVMAQLGAWVPAQTLTLSPMDAVYVRMGARDHIMAGQSTFMVELSETATMLRRATPRSLVVLDELGRGTSTSDGAAIAAAVLQYTVSKIGCLGMFATHYHRLAEDHRDDAAVNICHMGAKITPGAGPGDPDEVCFLYQLTAGACPKSYGHNVARLAGLPASVVAHAAMKAAELESVFRERASALAPASTANEAAATAASGADERRNSAAIVGDVIKLQAVLSAVGNGSLERVVDVWKGLSADGRAN